MIFKNKSKNKRRGLVSILSFAAAPIAASAIAIIPLASCVTTTKAKEDTKTKSGIKLNTNVAPTDIDMNDLCTPLTIETNSSGWLYDAWESTAPSTLQIWYRVWQEGSTPKWSELRQFPVGEHKGIILSAGGKIQFFGYDSGATSDEGRLSTTSAYLDFVFMADLDAPTITVGGNIASLLMKSVPSESTVGDTVDCYTKLADGYNFCSLFAGSDITGFSPNFLSSITTLNPNMYKDMFNNCTKLVKAPSLPATNLAESCYDGMFRACTSLNTAPSLPAIKLAQNCYRDMFQDCVSLNSVSISYVGNFKDKYFENWLLNVCAAGIIRYSGIQAQTRSANSIPAGWEIRKIVDCPVITIKPDNTTSKFSDGTTAPYTTAIYKDETYGTAAEDIPGVTQVSPIPSTVSATWYQADGTSVISNFETTEIQNLPGTAGTEEAPMVLIPKFNYNPWIDGFFNIKLEGTAGKKAKVWFARPNETSYPNQIIYYVSKKEYEEEKAAGNEPTWTVLGRTQAAALELEAGNETTQHYLFKGSLKGSITSSSKLNCKFTVGSEETLEEGETLNFTFGGTVMSLLYNHKVSDEENKVIPENSSFKSFFYAQNSVASVDTTKTLLPATTLQYSCYADMFYHLGTALKSAPDLPATDVPTSAYSQMFMNCISLTAAPYIAATKISSSAFYSMFAGCQSLATIQEELLPGKPNESGEADALPAKCYEMMFSGCYALQTAPKLPAIKFVEPDDNKTAGLQYHAMFENCTSLSNFPSDLLATGNVYGGAYAEMFSGCYALETAPYIAATKMYTTGGTGESSSGEVGTCESMFKNCTALTQFRKDSVENATFPNLTSIGAGCFRNAFSGCTELIEAPQMPKLAGYNDDVVISTVTYNYSQYAFNEAFNGDINLVKPIIFTNTGITGRAYNSPIDYAVFIKMYYGCSQLVISRMSTKPTYKSFFKYEVSNPAQMEYVAKNMFALTAPETESIIRTEGSIPNATLEFGYFE